LTSYDSEALNRFLDSMVGTVDYFVHLEESGDQDFFNYLYAIIEKYDEIVEKSYGHLFDNVQKLFKSSFRNFSYSMCERHEFMWFVTQTPCPCEWILKILYECVHSKKLTKNKESMKIIQFIRNRDISYTSFLNYDEKMDFYKSEMYLEILCKVQRQRTNASHLIGWLGVLEDKTKQCDDIAVTRIKITETKNALIDLLTSTNRILNRMMFHEYDFKIDNNNTTCIDIIEQLYREIYEKYIARILEISPESSHSIVENFTPKVMCDCHLFMPYISDDIHKLIINFCSDF
jgi:hypothetical protein